MLTPSAALSKDRSMSRRYKSPIMQHRQYAAIAAIISRLPKPIHWQTAEAFADELRGTNPNFDRARFLKACGVSE